MKNPQLTLYSMAKRLKDFLQRLEKKKKVISPLLFKIIPEVLNFLEKI